MATFVNDTFTDTNATAVLSHTGETGATWTRQADFTTGVATIQSNRAYHSGSGSLAFQGSGSPMNGNYEVTATIRIVSAVNGGVGVIGRAGASGFYLAYLSRVSTGGGTWSIQLTRESGGSFNTLPGTNNVIITSPSVGSDHTLTLRMVGSSFSAFWDGALTVGPLTDATISAAGKAGFYSDTVVTTTTGCHFDTVTAVDLVMGKAAIKLQAVGRAAYV